MSLKSAELLREWVCCVLFNLAVNTRVLGPVCRHGARVLEGTPLPPGVLEGGHDTLALAKKLAELRTTARATPEEETARRRPHSPGLEDLRARPKARVGA